LNLKANLASPTFTGTVGGITAAMVGLGSVNNTADSAKPVSTAQQTALDLKANLASPTFTGTMTVAGVRETVYALAGTAFSAANGTIQTKTISGATTFTDSMSSGDSILLILTNADAAAITWPSVVWVGAAGNVEPAWTTLDFVRLGKVGATLYASYGGSGA
jgi:hypothetical protein